MTPLYFDFFSAASSSAGVLGSSTTRRFRALDDDAEDALEAHLKETICPIIDVRFDSDTPLTHLAKFN